MIDALTLEPARWVALLWQTSLPLAFGAVLSLVFRERPARSHFVLTLAMAASVVLPVAAVVVAQTGWGLLPEPASTGNLPSTAPSSLTAVAPTMAISPAPAAARSVLSWLGVVWFVGTVVLVLHLLGGLLYGIRLLARAHPLVDEQLHGWLESARKSLDVERTPITFTTHAVRSPAIWCWAIHPALLLPPELVADRSHWGEIQWPAVFAHELAHVSRRDHFAAILAEIVCALLWWHPLAWWNRKQLHTLSDVACDRWVVSSGFAPDVYAETLLDVVPQQRTLTALSIVSGRRGLQRRMAALLATMPVPPSTGRPWSVAMTTAALCLVLLGACLQTKKPEAALSSSAAAVTIADPGMEPSSSGMLAWRQGASVPGVEYIHDLNVAHSGAASLCLRKTAQRYFPIAQWSQTISVTPSDRPRRARLSSWVRAEQAYKAILDVSFADAQGEWRHEWAAYIGARESGDPPANHDWQPYSGEVDVPPGASEIVVGLQIYGPGTVWFDDVVLELTAAPM